MTTLRLFHDYPPGETTTISYDYSRSCSDYSSRNATTIADLYWLSGESPKREAAASRQLFRPPRPAAGLPAGWSVPGGHDMHYDAPPGMDL